MAHVHNEYLEEEIGDQENVQMEMVVESTNDDISVLSESDVDVEKTSKSHENEKTVIKATKNGKVLVSGNLLNDRKKYMNILKMILKESILNLYTYLIFKSHRENH